MTNRKNWMLAWILLTGMAYALEAGVMVLLHATVPDVSEALTLETWQVIFGFAGFLCLIRLLWMRAGDS
jgi:hypothetical protein